MILEYKDWKKIYESKNSNYFLTLQGLNHADMSQLVSSELDQIINEIDSKIPDFDIRYIERLNRRRPSNKIVIVIKLPEKYLENEEGLTEFEFELENKVLYIHKTFMELSIDRHNYSKNRDTLQIMIKPEDATRNIEDLVLNRLLDNLLENKWTIDSLIKEIDETLEEVGMSIAVGSGFYNSEKTSKELSDLFSRLIFAIHLKKDLFNKYIKVELEEYNLDDISKKVEAMIESIKEKIAAPNLSDEDSEQIIKTLKYLLTDLRRKGGKFAKIANTRLAELIPHLNSAKSEKIQELIQKATRH